MKNNIILFVLLQYTFLLNAQVGINTNLPAATFDVTAKNQTGSATNVDGFLFPRVDRLRAQSMTGVPTSTLIYVNSIATGTQSGTATNIDAVGFYYFDGTAWSKLNVPINIYNSDGTLTGNRIVEMGTNSLRFQNTSSGPFLRILHTATNGQATLQATSRSNMRFLAGTSNLDIFQDSGNAGQIAVSGTSTGLFLGSAIGSTAPVNFMANGTTALTVINGGNVGVGTTTPQKNLHVNGALQVTNEINVGGNSGTAGSAGSSGQILTSNGAGAAPSWTTLNTVSGTVASANYVQGTTALTVNQGTTVDVPGVTITLTVPTGKTQTFLFTILGYAVNATSATGQATQGVFSLLQNGTKISSAYTSSGDGGNLVNLPAPTTFLKSVTLSAGTYIFKVQYSAWSGNQNVNFVPSIYAGYNGDTEAMLTKMQVLVYNN